MAGSTHDFDNASFFTPINLSGTSADNAASQTSSANGMLDITKGFQGALGKEFSQNRQLEARQGADFWQQSKENLAGVRNVTNGANRGADMGQAFSVMQGAGDANSVNANISRNASNAAKSVSDYGFGQQMATAGNSLQFERDVFETQNQIEQKNGSWNALADGINGAVSGYMGGNEYFNEGGKEAIGEKLSTGLNSLKKGFSGQSDLGQALKDTRAWAKHLNGGGDEIFAPISTWGAR
jgi:hypothetical protein